MSSKKETNTTGKDKNTSVSVKKTDRKNTQKKNETQKKNSTRAKNSSAAEEKSRKSVRDDKAQMKKPSGTSARTRSRKPADDLRGLDIPDIRRAPRTPVAVEILLWAVLAFCVFLFLSNVFGIGGSVGNSISRFFFGVFGVMSHIVPFGLFFMAAFLVSNRGNLTAWIKAGAICILFMCICAFCELLSNVFDVGRTFVDILKPEVGCAREAV